jgi:hypothetical protein
MIVPAHIKITSTGMMPVQGAIDKILNTEEQRKQRTGKSQ